MYKKSSLLLALLMVVPGCCWRKKQPAREPRDRDETMTQVDIPLAGDHIKSYFDEELEEYALADDASANALASAQTINEYSWVEEENQTSNTFKVVYFDFDKAGIKQTQEENVQYDAKSLKHLINDQVAQGKEHPDITIVVEGHACHSAGSSLYNLALSEKRAKTLADRLIAEGVSPTYIKVVGRGQEIPAVVNGKVVTGNRQEQWPNRRAELRIVA